MAQFKENPRICIFLQTTLSDFRENEAKIKKSGRVTFEPLLTPNFITNFGKILGAVFEICRYARTDGRTHETDSIGPAVFNLGPIKSGKAYNFFFTAYKKIKLIHKRAKAGVRLLFLFR